MKEQTISILEQALNGAAAKGSFNLKDSAIIFNALEIVKKIFDEHTNFENTRLSAKSEITQETLASNKTK